MKHITPLLIIVSGMVLAGCSDNDRTARDLSPPQPPIQTPQPPAPTPPNPAPPMQPMQTDFTAFLRAQFDSPLVASETAAPQTVEGVDFDLRNEDPAAYSDILARP